MPATAAIFTESAELGAGPLQTRPPTDVVELQYERIKQDDNVVLRAEQMVQITGYAEPSV